MTFPVLFLFAACASLGAGEQMETVSGVLRLTKGWQTPTVSLVTDTETMRLAGPQLDQLVRLQSAKVEVKGARSDGNFLVQAYTIQSIGGARPWVGTLSLQKEAFVLLLPEQPASPLVLTFGHRAKKRLQGKAGAKIWLIGKKQEQHLLVTRYGILQEPVVPRSTPKSTKDKDARVSKGAQEQKN